MIDVHDVLAQLQRTLVGKSVTAGTGNFALSGNAPYAGDPTNHLVDGQRVFYHRFRSDLSTAAFEEGFADFHAASGELRDKVVKRSSEATPTDPVNWTTDETYVGIYASPEAIAQWAKINAIKPPGCPWWVGILAQSNMHITIDENGTFPDIPAGHIRDMCTDGIGPYSASDPISFKDFVGADEWYEYASPYRGIHRSWYATSGSRFYQGTPPTSTAIGDLWFNTSDGGHPYKAASIGADEITAGEWESIQGDAGWTKNAHAGVLFCYWLSLISASIVNTTAASASGTNIDHPANGWLYAPGSGNTADNFKAMCTAAIAEPEFTKWNLTAPHFLVMAQGELEGPSKTSQQYAYFLSEVIEALFDPARWGVCLDGHTRMLVIDYPQGETYRDARPDWQGHALACAQHPTRTILIPTDGMQPYLHTWDAVHWNDYGSAEIASRLLNAVAATAGTLPSHNGAMVVDRGAASSAYASTLVINDDGDPSAGETNLNTAQDRLLIHKTQTGSQDITYLGLSQLSKNPDNHPDQGYIVYTFLTTWEFYVEGPVITHENWYEVPVSIKTTGSGGGALFCSFVDFARPPKPISGMRALASLPLSAKNLEIGQESKQTKEVNVRLAGVNHLSQLVRLEGIVPHAFGPALFSGAGTHRVYRSEMTGGYTTGTLVKIEVHVNGVRDGDNTQTCAYVVSGVLRKTATTWVLNHASTHVETIEDHSTTFTWVLENYNNGSTHEIACRTPGVTGEDWHFSGTASLWLITEAP